MDRSESRLLLLDAVINLLLGLLLALFPRPLLTLLGLPLVENAFYPRILGGVLFGIGIALLLERFLAPIGLGLGGAIAINLCGAAALAAGLIIGVPVSARGAILLWSLVLILLAVSLLELPAVLKKRES